MIDEINKIRNEIDKIIERLSSLENDFKKKSPERISDSTSDEFDYLKGLLESDVWPEAVPEFQIADESSESDKDERAESIVDFFIGSLSLAGKKILDFGCGEGHIANQISKTTEAFGYDIVVAEKSRFVWEEKVGNLLLTSDFEVIKANGPYDKILIYDVLDHAENPTDVLMKAKSVLAEDGQIHLRCHPWSSRHGGHIYRQINKAFVHIVFSESELANMGVMSDVTIKNKVIYPIGTYEKYISSAGLTKISIEIDEQEPEKFFSENAKVAERIKLAFPENNGLKKREHFPDFQLKQCFLDFILK